MKLYPTRPPTAGVRIRIGVADDHRVICDALGCLLENEPDFSIVGRARDGIEALELATEQNPDILILDLTMPRLNGIAATSRLRRSHPDLAVIILSRHSEEGYVRQALTAGARGYVLKESAASELVTAIRTVMGGGVHLSGPILGMVVDGYIAGVCRTKNPLDALSKRETEVLRHHAQGMNTREISELLHLSVKTVETYRYRIKEKLDLRGNTEMIKFAIRNGLADPES